MDKFTSVMDQIAGVADKANVNMVFGEPKEVHGRVLIPVAEVSYGFGLGLGSASVGCSCGCEDETCSCDEDPSMEEPCCCNEEECTCGSEEECTCGDEEGGFGGGGGAGARVRPLAYIDVGPEGAKIVPIQDEQKITMMGIALGLWCVGWIGLVLKSLL